MPRLFTGLEIPNSQRLMLSLVQNGLSNVRWIDPSQFHITLQFIGDVSLRGANDIADILSGPMWCSPTIKMTELACFGGTKPTSIHARVEHDPALMALATSHDRLMQRLGMRSEKRRYSPHVTLARCKGATSDKVANYLNARAGLNIPEFQPTRFVLFSARESIGGGPYRVEESWAFEPPPTQVNEQAAYR